MLLFDLILLITIHIGFTEHNGKSNDKSSKQCETGKYLQKNIAACGVFENANPILLHYCMIHCTIRKAIFIRKVSTRICTENSNVF